MEIQSNYEKCVIINDLQRQLHHYDSEYKTATKTGKLKVWEVWYNRNYLGSIHKLDRSDVYTMHVGACGESDVAFNFMEALAFYVEYLVDYIELEEEVVELLPPPEESPEATILKALKKIFVK